MAKTVSNWNEELNLLRCRYYAGRKKELLYKLDRVPAGSPYERILRMDLQDVSLAYSYYRKRFRKNGFKRYIHG